MPGAFKAPRSPAPVRYTCVQDPGEASLGSLLLYAGRTQIMIDHRMSVDRSRRAMPKQRTLAQQIAALKPGRQTIEAERDELPRIKDGAVTAAEARRRAAAWRTAGDEQKGHGQVKIKISEPLIRYAERLDALKRIRRLRA